MSVLRKVDDFIRVKQKDEAYKDVGATRWGNRDLYPIVESERQWGGKAYWAYLTTAGVCLSSWTLGSSLIGYGLTAGQACGGVLVGSVLASLNALLCGRMGTDHHLGYTMAARAAFGLYGAYMCIALSCIQSLVYFGMQSYFGGQALVIVLSAIFPSFLRLKNTLPDSAAITTQALAGFLLYFVIFVPIVFVPPYKLQRFLYPSTVVITVTCFGVLGWAIHANGGSPGNLVKPSIAISKYEGTFRMVQGICSVAGSYTGATVRISDWTRFARSHHAATPSMLIALPLTITLGALIGVLVTSATEEMYGTVMWNPLIMLQYVQQNQYTAGCRAGTFFAGLGFLTSQVFVNMTQNVVSSGMDLAAVIPRYVTLRRGGLLMCFLGILIQPWRFLTQATVFVTVISSFGVFVAPMTAIIVIDYWAINHRRWNIPDLYRQGGKYWYIAGFNWKAFAVFFLVVAPSMPGFVVAINAHSINEGWTRVFEITYFLGYGAAAILYFVLNKILPTEGRGFQVNMPEIGFVEGLAPHGNEVDEELERNEKEKKVFEVSDKASSEV